MTQTDRDDIPVEITIDAQGRFFVNQKLVINKKLSTLIQALRKEIGDSGASALIINADANTPHQFVIKAMDAARHLGIEKLSLATKEVAE